MRSRRRLSARLAPGLVLGLALGVVVSACFDGLGGPERPPGSAVWLATDTPVPDVGTLGRLRALGVAEIFVEVASLGADSALTRHEVAELPAGTAVTLVVSGGAATDAARFLDAAVASAIDSDLRQLRFEAEGRGWVPIGIHFDVLGVSDLAAYADFLDAVRASGDRSLFVSASVARDWLARDGVERVVDAVDAVVAFLYGQRPEEAETPSAWDFIALEERLTRLEAMGGQYFLGVGTLGLAYSSDGSERGRTDLRLRDVLWGGFTLEPGFSLEGVNRMLFAAKADRDLRIGDWRIRRGSRIRLVRPAAAHIEELERLLGAWQLPGLLGSVYYRLPRRGERLSLSAETLAAARDTGTATPRIRLEGSLRRATGRGFLFRFTITNDGPGTTELSVLENNILQVSAVDGGRQPSIGRVDTGDFERFALFRRKGDGSFAPTFRGADTVRLHLPILEEGESASTGDVEILVPSAPRLELEAWFILPDGRTTRLGPASWRDGVALSNLAPDAQGEAGGETGVESGFESP